MENKKAKYETYRDIPHEDVSRYAAKHSLNIDSHENHREAAQALFTELYPEKRKKQIMENAKTESKHTTGPWKIQRFDRAFEIQSAEGDFIAGITPKDYDPELEYLAEANARLIASAPQLLQGLKDMLDLMEANRNSDMKAGDWTEGQEAMWQDAWQAVSSATGGEEAA